MDINLEDKQKEESLVKKGTIYLLYFTEGTSKKYVGLTTRKLWIRFSEHKSCNKSTNTYLLHRAIVKYGKDKVRMKILHTMENVPLAELQSLEKKYIAEYGTLKPNGYNVTPGGEGVLHSTEMRERKRELAYQQHNDPVKRANWEKGIYSFYNEENREKIGERFKKLFADPEYREKWRSAMEVSRTEERVEKARAWALQHITEYNNKRYGTSEERAKKRELKRQEYEAGRAERHQREIENWERNKRPTLCVTSGITYPSIKEAAIAEGCNRRAVSAVLCGRQKTTRGKVFKYADK